MILLHSLPVDKENRSDRMYMRQQDLLTIDLPHTYLENENTAFIFLLLKYMKKIAKEFKIRSYDLPN